MDDGDKGDQDRKGPPVPPTKGGRHYIDEYDLDIVTFLLSGNVNLL